MFEKILLKYNIEFRRGNAGGGNQLRQPYLKEILKSRSIKNFQNVEKVHFYGYYIGNYPDLKKIRFYKLQRFLIIFLFNLKFQCNYLCLKILKF